MPDAHVENDGTLRGGLSSSEPDLAVWSSITPPPRLELFGRYTTIVGLNAGLGPAFGDYKDKAFDAKLGLLRGCPGTRRRRAQVTPLSRSCRN